MTKPNKSDPADLAALARTTARIDQILASGDLDTIRLLLAAFEAFELPRPVQTSALLSRIAGTAPHLLPRAIEAVRSAPAVRS